MLGHLDTKIEIFELCEFLTDMIKVRNLDAQFRYRVGLHTSCHGQRGLKLSSNSECIGPAFSKPENLLSKVEGIKISKPNRLDECCGFGGTFCVTEEAVSVAMGNDRILEHEKNEVEYITSADVSCLMHLEGLLKRKKSSIKVIHIAEILNCNVPAIQL